MAKILVHLELSGGDTFVEIVNLNRVWISQNYFWGEWALRYSDDNWEANTLGYSYTYDIVDSARKKLVEAYKNGEESVSL